MLGVLSVMTPSSSNKTRGSPKLPSQDAWAGASVPGPNPLGVSTASDSPPEAIVSPLRLCVALESVAPGSADAPVDEPGLLLGPPTSFDASAVNPNAAESFAPSADCSVEASRVDESAADESRVDELPGAAESESELESAAVQPNTVTLATNTLATSALAAITLAPNPQPFLVISER